MRKRFPSAHTFVLLALSAFLAGTYAFLFLVGPFFSSTLEQATRKVGANTLMYGKVASVDASTNIIDIEAEDPFEATRIVRVEVHVAPQAYIAEEHFVAQNGIYTSLSKAVSAPLSDIQNGAYIAFAPERDAQGDFSTSFILFGMPL